MNPDEPPDYEAPPDYEEVIKIGMEQEIREPRQRQRRHHRHRDRSCSRAALQQQQQPQLSQSNNVAINNLEQRPTTSAAAIAANAATNTTEPNLQDMASRVFLATAVCGNLLYSYFYLECCMENWFLWLARMTFS